MALPSPDRDDDLLTIAEAADVVGVRPDTLARWFEEDDFPEQRVGSGEVRVRRADVERFLYGPPDRAGGPQPLVPYQHDPSAINHELIASIEPMTEEESRDALAALEAAKELQRQILADRGGVPLPPSWPLIREAREDR